MIIIVTVAVVMVYTLSMIKGKPAPRTLPIILDTQEK
jgi:hypothetical protein